MLIHPLFKKNAKRLPHRRLLHGYIIKKIIFKAVDGGHDPIYSLFYGGKNRYFPWLYTQLGLPWI